MSIVLPDERRMILEETPWLCEGTENAVLQCAIEAALSGFGDSYHDFALVDARALPAGQHTLYVVDHTIEMDAVDGLSWRFSVMHASLSYAPGRALHTYIISAPESFPRLTPGGSMSADPLDAATRETCFAILASLAVEPSPTQAVTSNLGQVPVVTPSMASSAATGEPMAVPEGWLEYRTYGGSLSVWYPPQWTIEDEDAHDVSFDVTDRDYAYAAVGAYRTDCVADKDSEDTLRCLTAEILHGASSLDTTRVVSSAVQDTAQGPAFVIEIATKDYVYKSWSATVFVDRIHPSGLIGLNYGRVGVEELTDAERELALEVCDTVRPLP